MHAGYNRLNTRERGEGMQLVQVIICHISTHSGGRGGRGARGRRKRRKGSEGEEEEQERERGVEEEQEGE